MRVQVGTSGFAYKEWRGRFYPEKMKEAEMLAFYASRFGAVEINNTFYRMPKADMLAKWTEQVPKGFTFVLKASRRISHIKRLKDVGPDLDYFLETSAALGEWGGPILVQLPPNLKKDAERLKSFLGLLARRARVAVEFRHESWFDEETYGLLRDHGAALCLAEADDDPVPAASLPATAGWGYLRLRRLDYDTAKLEAWAARVRQEKWTDAFVFFKHEDEARGPELAQQFQAMFARA